MGIIDREEVIDELGDKVKDAIFDYVEDIDEEEYVDIDDIINTVISQLEDDIWELADSNTPVYNGEILEFYCNNPDLIYEVNDYLGEANDIMDLLRLGIIRINENRIRDELEQYIKDLIYIEKILDKEED